ncbi:hypothetical protein E4T56_gene1226 [Termitomyces sp. T112]|nr:hypothetical protein C0989_008519 [Termitomyces sp. Mn162]KAG5734156.1 hypothetical protein E4T56_gene1226 [Termitomyces sp. T112]KAH0579267.1 hypothetical protein H2248_003414 [Termitomyces sp. 'cryptogamus']KNZ79672.1 hypothetical protein J132_08883 [Termitomyces sp. J132]
MAESLRTYLNEPVLFALNLPQTINYDHLWAMFKNLLVTRITLSAGYLVFCPTKEGWSRLLMHGLQTAKIEFADIGQAEKALTKMNSRPIPNISPPEILKLSTSPDTEIPPLPRHLRTDGHGSERRTSPPLLEEAVASHTTNDLDSRIEIQQRPQIAKEAAPYVDSLREDRTRVNSLLKPAERELWRRELDVSQSRIKVLELQIEEERKKAAKEMASQKDAADRVAREQARKDALVTEIERCRQRDAHLCKWERSAALERFLLVLDEFEGRTRSVSETRPLTFEGIPWPTLDNPLTPSFQADAITWEKVEAFFSYAKRTLLHHQYSKLVERVHRLFHPDKWRARRVLDTVPGTDLRQAVEQSVNTVAQAMTPIWKESKGRG